MYEHYQKLLDEKNLKNADVARATGISNATLSDWKKGCSTPKTDKLQKIADFLGTTVEYLTTGKNPSVPNPELSDEYIELIDLYSKLSVENQSAIMQIMKSLNE